MKIEVKKGLIEVSNEHELLLKSFANFLSRKSRAIKLETNLYDKVQSLKFTFIASTLKVKDVKSLMQEMKQEWMSSDFKKKSGVSKSGLKERGWTEKAIKDFLGDYDFSVVNPHYKSGPDIKIWASERVIKAEASEKWIEWYQSSIAKREKLKESSSKTANTKRQKLLTTIDSLNINIPKWDKEKLTQRACNHYNDLWAWRGKLDKFASPKSDTDFLNRISVNFLRHEMTEYEEKIAHMFGKVGKQEGYEALKEKVLNAIAEVYPHLNEEVKRQRQQIYSY